MCVCVKIHTYGEEVFEGEGHDLVFEFDCKAASGCVVHYWSGKQ